MKKLLALLLSVIMAASLAVPAFAAEPEESAPEDVIPISAFLPEAVDDSTFGIIGGADGPTSIITTIPVDLGSLDLGSLDWGPVLELDVSQYLADHPGLEEQLKANAYNYFNQEYGGCWTVEEYMEDMGQTEEEFLDDMVWEQAWELVCQEADRKTIDWQKEGLGGVPGQVGVMVNGQYIQFPDAAPEEVNGRTMVPVRTLVEALGGEVSYQDSGDKTGFVSMPQVVCTANGVTVTFEANGANVEVARQSSYDSGEVETDSVTMPVVTYQKGGHTYVPVRFLAGALGYEVGWDSQFETAILLDRAALAAKFDEKFTIMNRVQANSNPALDEGKSWDVDVKGDLSVTVFDTLNGSKTYKAGLTTKALMNDQAFSGTYSVTISDNAVDKLMELIVGSSWPVYADEEEVALLRKTIEGLKDMGVIMTREGLVWVHAPILDELLGEEDVWSAMDMGAELGELLFGQLENASTIGSVLAAMVSADSVASWNAAAGMMGGMMYDLYGDDKFTTSGGVSTLTIGVDELTALYENMGMSYAGEVLETWKDYSITIKVDSKGAATVTCVMETNPQLGVPAMRITMDGTQNGQSAQLTMKIHVSNVGEMELTCTSSQRTTSDAPKTEPPEDAVIIEADSPMPLPEY